MSQCIFDAISLLEEKLSSEHLNIHETKEMLADIVKKSRANTKLRIITQFLVILHALTDEYEYENTDQISFIKELVNKSLSLIRGMSEGTINYTQGVYLIEQKIVEISSFFKRKIGTDTFLSNSILSEQLAVELKTEMANIKIIIDQLNEEKKDIDTQFKEIVYHLKRLITFVDLIGVTVFCDELHKIKDFIIDQYNKNQLPLLKENKLFQEVLFYFYEVGLKISAIYHSTKELTSYINSINSSHFPNILEDYTTQMNKENSFSNTSEEGSKNNLRFSRNQHMDDYTSLLSSDEINALMNNDDPFPSIDFDQVPHSSDTKEEAVPFDLSLETANDIFHQQQNLYIPSTSIKIDHIKDEDKLIQLTGKLFLKQEQIKYLISKDNQMMLADLTELDQLTDDIKQVLFQHYYISFKNLLGEELRTFIKTEATNLGKKLRLGIKGEDVEILSREQDFVKKIVFDIVGYSLQRSIEVISRRKALDKNESASLLIEFDDSGDTLSIYIRDDGRGISDDATVLTDIQSKVIEKQGLMDIETEENEYLKIRIHLPMKKIITKSLVVQIKDTKFLFPSKSILQILTPSEAAIILKTDHCLGQIALTTLTGMDRSIVNAYLFCLFGNEKILLGVENILYYTEALMEKVNVPLIPCTSSVVVLKDGTIGFVIDERKIYSESKKLIEKRTEIFLENMII
ncbi:MAG: hypothetical protein ACRCTJ_02035 [Brevinema sp.]